MDATKLYLLLCLFISGNLIGQSSPYPKDTIFILFDNDLHEKKILKHPEHGKNIYFKNLDVYYNLNYKSDTLPIQQLSNYHFSDMPEIKKKVIDWVEKKYAGQKYKPHPWSKNSVFHTYLIEVISEDAFVVYPVIWRNEGVID